MLRLYPSRIDVGWFIYYFCTYPSDPSDRGSDRSSEPFTSLDQSGNSLAAHLAFGHLPGLHSPEGARSAKNGTPSEESAITKSWEHLETLGQEFWIGTEGPAEPPFPASDRCLREAGGKAGRRVGVGACRRRTRSPATDIDTLVFGPATKMAKRGRFASNADPSQRRPASPPRCIFSPSFAFFAKFQPMSKSALVVQKAETLHLSAIIAPVGPDQGRRKDRHGET